MKKVYFKKGRKIKIGLPGFWQFAPWFWRGFDVDFQFNETCVWEDPKDPNIPFSQLNKLVGITGAFGYNDENAALTAWRPSKNTGTVDVHSYVNGRKTKGKRSMEWSNAPIYSQKHPWKIAKIKVRILKVDLYPKQYTGFFQNLLVNLIDDGKNDHKFVASYKAFNSKGEEVAAYEHDFNMPWHRMFRLVNSYFGGQLPPHKDLYFARNIKLISVWRISKDRSNS